MKARKRTERPACFPDGKIRYRYAVLTKNKGGVYWDRAGVVMAANQNEAERAAVIQFSGLSVRRVLFWDEWRLVVLQQDAQRTKAQTTQHPSDEPRAPKPAKVVQKPPMTEDQRLAARQEYARLKAAYFAGETVEITDDLRDQFERFPPNQRIIGPMAGECESTHRTKPIGTHKWRPLQSGFSITDVCKILEHENDNDHETA